MKKEKITYTIRAIYFDAREKYNRFFVKYDVTYSDGHTWKDAMRGEEDWQEDAIHALIGFSNWCRKNKQYKITLVDGRKQ